MFQSIVNKNEDVDFSLQIACNKIFYLSEVIREEGSLKTCDIIIFLCSQLSNSEGLASAAGVLATSQPKSDESRVVVGDAEHQISSSIPTADIRDHGEYVMLQGYVESWNLLPRWKILTAWK